jgi:hypothetical protein
MDNFTDSNGKPVYIDASKVTHVSINIETQTPEIHFIGGGSTIVVDNLNNVLGVVKLEGALS